MRAIGVGFGLGFLVALQLGPISLFAIRTTLRQGWRIGLAIGAGVACVDTLYAAAGAAGAAPLLAVDALRIILGAIGAAVLAVLAARTLWSAWRVRSGNEFDAEVATAGRAFMLTLGATASNPLTIASWAAIFAAASAGTHASTGELLLGVGLGSLAWMVIMISAVAAVRRAVGARAIRVADAIAGLGMLGFAGALGYRTGHES
ncbi:MAG TPA: LysE family transporter [Jatrophihabitantaceae bacterium]|jgi:putative LysE/RhtB family amino acid efflux pump